MSTAIITTHPFSEHDLGVHRKTIRRRWLNLLATFVVLWGIYGIALTVKEVRDQYLLVMMPFLIPFLFFIGLSVRGFVRLYKDGRLKEKYSGNYTVETEVFSGDKSTNYNLYIFVNGEKRKIRIKESELDQVQSGVTAYIEFSVHATTIFKFVQEGREVVFRQM